MTEPTTADLLAVMRKMYRLQLIVWVIVPLVAAMAGVAIWVALASGATTPDPIVTPTPTQQCDPNIINDPTVCDPNGQWVP